LKSEEVALIPETFFDVKSRFVPELMEIMIEQVILMQIEVFKSFPLGKSILLLQYESGLETEPWEKTYIKRLFFGHF
jgi:hypothetical protein